MESHTACVAAPCFFDPCVNAQEQITTTLLVVNQALASFHFLKYYKRYHNHDIFPSNIFVEYIYNSRMLELNIVILVAKSPEAAPVCTHNRM